MRREIRAELGQVPHARFLVYLMGPYESFDGDDGRPSRRQDHGHGRDRAGFDLLLDVRDRLRTEPGVNAFLAVDADIDLDDVDAASQSVRFARASNAVAFVAPEAGRNLGVGVEAGSVLEDVLASERTAERSERVVFVHEDGLTSAMVASLARRWNVTVYSYGDVSELVFRLRAFVLHVMHREASGDLPTLAG